MESIDKKDSKASNVDVLELPKKDTENVVKAARDALKSFEEQKKKDC